MEKRKLFCDISPLTYKISVYKCTTIRSVKNLFGSSKIAKVKSNTALPTLIYSHNSLIRRRLGNVDMTLQENKAINLNIAAPKVSHIIIKPGETFSFWQLVGNCTEKKGYKEGLIIGSGKVAKGIGGGMCQFTNLIHWLVLHTPMQITEYHHHDGIDLFPDNGRQIPFGSGTSIMYNYLDYRFKNTTTTVFQLIIYTTDEYLCGELRASEKLSIKYHIKAEDECFTRENGIVYRNGKIYRECRDVNTGDLLQRQLLKENHAKVMYDTADIAITESQ